MGIVDTDSALFPLSNFQHRKSAVWTYPYSPLTVFSSEWGRPRVPVHRKLWREKSALWPLYSQNRWCPRGRTPTDHLVLLFPSDMPPFCQMGITLIWVIYGNKTLIIAHLGHTGEIYILFIFLSKKSVLNGMQKCMHEYSFTHLS